MSGFEPGRMNTPGRKAVLDRAKRRREVEMLGKDPAFLDRLRQALAFFKSKGVE